MRGISPGALFSRAALSLAKYDPARFYLIYALKATVAMALAATLAFVCGLGMSGAIFALNITMGIFFLGDLDTTDRHKLGFLALYLVLSSCFLPMVHYFMALRHWLFLPVFIWIFFVSYSVAYNVNLNKILLVVSTTGFVGFIAYESGILDVWRAVAGLWVGWGVSVSIKFGRFNRYGAFVFRSMQTMINDACDMTRALKSSQREFNSASDKTISHINSLKAMFKNDSINLKDARLIRNHARAVFYLYKMEEIYYSLISIRGLFLNIPDKQLLSSVRWEIFHNLRELSRLLEGKSPRLKDSALNAVKQSRFSILASALEVLYSHVNLIKEGGEDKISLKGQNQISLKQWFLGISLHDAKTLAALRFAFCVSIAIFISQVTKLDHGVWIAVAVFSLNRTNRYTLKAAGRDNIMGGLLGFGLAMGAISLFGSLPVMYVLAAFGMFLVYYLKNYSQFAFAMAFMFEFCTIFYFIKDDFMTLMLHRLFDVFLGFVVVYVVSLFTLPKDSEDLKVKVKTALDSFIGFFDDTLIGHKKGSFVPSEQRILSALLALRSAALVSKNDKARQIARLLEFINTDLISLRNYIKALRDREQRQAAIDSDLAMLERRFEMMSKKLNSLPYYFVKEANEKILSADDAKLNYLITRVLNLQNEIYSLL
ncbi:FUSC family protein [Campylobacter sp. 19-13652]|uniref:FUSC family protein n=1 Tax=Campylobacter sp. 19-13652 TaxID=2840180 RepID=UPI001C74BE68|nr:FUSC family protein [Campylobacter sp. 19-13652]BCX79574.1 hypothetical protein LBC_10360 [Campylobacter sp. 19-13652]